MTLKRWGDERPEVGRCVILYPSEHDYGFWVRVHEIYGAIVVDGPETVPMQAVHPTTRWCYTAEPPDWSKLDE